MTLGWCDVTLGWYDVTLGQYHWFGTCNSNYAASL